MNPKIEQKKESYFTRLFRRMFTNVVAPVDKKAAGRFGRQMKRQAVRNRLAYSKGNNGLSAVSEAIQKDWGAILSRRRRKRSAKIRNVNFIAYYNYGR